MKAKGARAALRQAARALALGAALLAFPAATEEGMEIFQQHCAACHSTVPGAHGKGPSLGGVIGRRAGSARGFEYSDAMRSAGRSGLVWDAARLDAFLAAPQRVLPGVRMDFSGLDDAAQRAAVIRLLEGG